MIPVFSFPGATIILPPEVAIDFVAGTATAGGASAVITDLVSCTQAGTTYARTEAGVLTSFAPNTLRITDAGLLVEGARTNHCPESTTPGVVNGLNTWATTVTVTANDTTAPDGTTTAYRLTDTAATISHQISRSTITPGVITGQSAFSVFAKPNTLEFIELFWGNVGVVFDLTAKRWQNRFHGSVVTAKFYHAYIEEYTDGWCRCVIVVDANTIIPRIVLLKDDTLRNAAGSLSSVPTYLGDATGSLWVWGPQIEAGAFASTYIPTVGKVTATRAADVVAFTGAADTLLNVDSDTARSVITDVALLDGAVAQKIITGAAGTPILIGQSGGDDRRALNTVSTSIVADQSDNGAMFTAGMAVGSSWSSSGRTVVAGGGASTAGSAETFGAGTRYIGDSLFGRVRNVKAWDVALSAAQLRFLTQPDPLTSPTVTTPEEDYYFWGPAPDTVSLISAGRVAWTVTGLGNAYSDGVAFYTGEFERDSIMPAALPGNWTLGPGPRFHHVNNDVATVSLGAATTAPDGSSNALKIVESTSLSQHYLIAIFDGGAEGEGMNFDPGIRQRFSVFLKAGECTRAVLIITDNEYTSSSRGGVNGFKALFDLVGGTVVDTYEFGEWRDQSIGAEITGWGDGWYRCTLKVLVPWFDHFQHKHRMKVGIELDAGFGTTEERTYYTGDGTSGLYMWRANCLPLVVDEQIDAVFIDDGFDDINTIDVYDTRDHGYNFYTHRTWPCIFSSQFSDTNPPDPAAIEVVDSHYRQQWAAIDITERIGINTCAWAGTEAIALVNGQGLVTDTTPYDEVAESFVGKAFRPPFLAEATYKIVDFAEAAPASYTTFWFKDLRAYMAPYTDEFGVPQALEWPTQVEFHIEYDIMEYGFATSFHVIQYTEAMIGNPTAYTQIDVENIVQSEYADHLGVGTTAEIYASTHRYSGLWLPNTETDVGVTIFFIDGAFIGGWNTNVNQRDVGDDRYHVCWVQASGSEFYDVKISGNAAISMLVGTADAPL